MQSKLTPPPPPKKKIQTGGCAHGAPFLALPLVIAQEYIT